MSEDGTLGAAGERLLQVLRRRAPELGLNGSTDHELLTRLELELREYGDHRQAAVKALRERIAPHPPMQRIKSG